MKSPQVVRSRIASGNMAKKSPARAKSSKRGKENMGLSTASLKVTKSKESKVRPVPDFGKLHRKWEEHLNGNKAQAKKPLTIVQEFDFSKPGMKKEPLKMKQLNKPKSEIWSSTQSTSRETGFKQDREAFQSIVSNQGIRLLKENKSRITLAAIDVNTVKRDQNTALKEEVPDCERDSFGTLANIQQQFGIEFQQDGNALKSILDSTGVKDHDLTEKAYNPSAVRQTIDVAGFKAPMTATPQSVRKSIYYNGSRNENFSKQFVYSEFARRMASRLTLDANTPKPLATESTASPAPKVIQQRNSIYVKVDYGNKKSKLPASPSKEMRNNMKTPMSERKAQRIMKKTPTKSPAGRILSQSTTKKRPFSQWADLLGPRTPVVKDSVQVKLFEDDDSSQDENEPLATKLEDDMRLKEIEEVERKLQKEIEEMEKKKIANQQQQQQQVIVIDKNSPAYNRPAPSTPSKPTSRSASDSAIETQMVNVHPASPKPTKKRMVLGELNDQEIGVRSSPSYRERGRSRNKVKSAPTFADCVFGEDSKSKKVQFKTPNVLKHPESPSARYHKNSVSSSQASSSDELIESPKASRVSALRKVGRYSPMGRSSKARDYSPTSRLRDNQVYKLVVELDKENCSPIRPVTFASKKSNVVITPSKNTVITEEEDEFIVEYDVLEHSIQEMSIQDINQTMSESVVAMNQLQNEAESLMEQSNLDETASGTIMEQMDLIQKKQQELEALQKALQQKLEQRKKKKKLNFDAAASSNSKKTIQGIKKQEDVKLVAVKEVSKKDVSKAVKKENLKMKMQISERNVVDVSPISFGLASDGYGGFSSNVVLTPENNGDENLFDYENSPTLFPVNKNQTLRQPLHSTAHESQHHAKLDESSKMVVSPVQNKTSEGGILSQGLLQMAQNFNATPHKNMHWKKQYLTSNDENKDGPVSLPEDSFYENGDNCKTPQGYQTPERRMQPIGTPFSFSSTVTPKILCTPISQRRMPTLVGSPKSLFSGTAQLLANSPIQTPLALREAVQGAVHSKDFSPANPEEISIDASPEFQAENLGTPKSGGISTPNEKKLTPIILKNPGSLSLAANLIAKKSPTAFQRVSKPKVVMCNAIQGSLLSKVRGKYMDALADDEVSLYTTRLQMATSFGIRCNDPVSKILQEGDDYHFVPIVEIKSPPRIVPSIGSAFSSSAFRQIRV